MKFNPYPKDADLPVFFYPQGIQNARVGKVRNKLTIEAADPFTKKRISDFLLDLGIDINSIGLREFYSALCDNDLINTKQRSHFNTSRATTSHSYQKNYGSPRQNAHQLDKTPSQLKAESGLLDLNTAPFRDKTINNISVIISSNEPPALGRLFEQSKLINISVAHLDVADVVAIDNKTGDTLFIERKTVSDLYSSVTVGARTHNQSERMFDAVNELISQGKRARAIWIIESEQNDNNLLDSALPLIQQMTGLIGYLSFINEQNVIQSYSMNHTVYSSLKFIQAFFEQKLFYSVETNDPRVNRSAKERLAAKRLLATANDDPLRTGVKRFNNTNLVHMLSYIPAINTRVASELAKTGKSFSEVTQMTLEELEAIKCIGKKSANEIFNAFNIKA